MSPKQNAECEKVVTVACVNFSSVWGNKKATLEKMKANIKEAAAQGSDIIIFPELALSGAECTEDARSTGKPCRMHREAAETVPGPATRAIARLAREHDVYVIFGMPERDAKNPEVQYNAAAIVAPEGILGTYRKVHLGTLPLLTEDICFKAGDEIPVWETRFGPVGVQICYDFWLHPELSRIQALKGARVIVNISASFSGPAKREYMVQQTGARATENFVYTASANMVGTEKTFSFYGHSTIAGPAYPRMNHIYAEAGDGEEIVSATLSFEKLDRWHVLFDWKKRRRGDVILKEFKGIS